MLRLMGTRRLHCAKRRTEPQSRGLAFGAADEEKERR